MTPLVLSLSDKNFYNIFWNQVHWSSKNPGDDYKCFNFCVAIVLRCGTKLTPYLILPQQFIHRISVQFLEKFLQFENNIALLG